MRKFVLLLFIICVYFAGLFYVVPKLFRGAPSIRILVAMMVIFITYALYESLKKWFKFTFTRKKKGETKNNNE